MAELSTLGAVIKGAYEGQADTNAYSNAEKAKVAAVRSELSALQTAMDAVTVLSTVDATDLATAITLVNACKAKINQILVASQT